MKKIIYLMFMLIFFSLQVNAGEKKKAGDFKLILDFHSYPFFSDYVPTFMSGYSLNGSLFLGGKIGKFSFGAELMEQYISLKSTDAGIYKVFCNRLNFIMVFCCQPVFWFGFKTGAGGMFYADSFVFEKEPEQIGVNGAVTLLLDLTFNPNFKYIDLMLLNKFDILISENNSTLLYCGKIRAVFHPYVTWLSLYLECGIQTMKYKNLPDDFNKLPGIDNRALFVWGAGTTINLTIPSMFKNRIKKNRDDEQKKDDKTDEFKNIKEGEIVIFSNIIFYPDIDKIKEESYPELDKLADALKQRSDILLIEIIGHTNTTNNPDAELALSVKRAEAVKNYLVSKGIDLARMKTTGNGSKYTKGASINEANRKVEIRIIDIK